MTIWVDAHLSPAIATWITNTFGIEAIALRDLGLRDAEDQAQILGWVAYTQCGIHFEPIIYSQF
jgi:predicted nuclease of predicted toxin-antitoxin system